MKRIWYSVTKQDVNEQVAAVILSKAKCEHMNEDGSFRDGFSGCVNHMTSECGGGHSEESAKRICGAINRDKNG